MHTFFRGKVVRIMPKRYDEEFKARAVRLVIDHAEEYDTRTACVAAVAKRLGIAPETLRRWITQAEVDSGVRDGVPTDRCANYASSNARTKSLRKLSRYYGRPQLSSCGRATRDTADLCVHCRASCSVRGRSDLPRAHRAWLQDRPENVLCLAGPTPVRPGLVGHGHHRSAGRLLRARRARWTQAGVVVRSHEDVAEWRRSRRSRNGKMRFCRSA